MIVFGFLLSALKNEQILVLVLLLVAQYALAVFALYKLIHTAMPVKKLLLWNLFVLFVLFVGPLVAIIKSKKLPAFSDSKAKDTDDSFKNYDTSTKAVFPTESINTTSEIQCSNKTVQNCADDTVKNIYAEPDNCNQNNEKDNADKTVTSNNNKNANEPEYMI